MNTKKFTILHSNDMHGDFLAESRGEQGNLIGGLGLLSGYINKVRREEKNVLYFIAGDMVQGSMIDAEFKGISTMEIMNYLAPDAVTLGNHEMDYGLAHLLFLEKIANFPIVNANLYIRKYNRRLMRPHVVLHMDGFDILVIGLITQDVIKAISLDNNVGTFISLEDAAAEVGVICNAYKDEDIDLTILLTHIGYEADLKLAEMLDPRWGVDLIIGGHSHTILEKPAEVNNVLITQAGVGTDQIGRFDITVDDDTNSIVEWKWQLLPVDTNLSEPDGELQKFIDSFKDVVDRKYNTMVCRLARKLTHPARGQETEMGNLFADIFADNFGLDAAFFGSNSFRDDNLGPAVTLGDLKRVVPYDGPYYKMTLNGEALWKVFSHFPRVHNYVAGGPSNYFQTNHGTAAVFNESTNTLESLKIKGRDVDKNAAYTIGIQEYHLKNALNCLGIPPEETTRLGNPITLTTSQQDVVREYLGNHQNLNAEIEGRMVFTK